MAVKGEKRSGCKGGVGQKNNTLRHMLVRAGKASWVPVRLYNPGEAWEKTGLP